MGIKISHTCSICGKEYEGHGNNAHPYPGRCCDECNTKHVIPARFKLAALRDEATKCK